MTIPNSRTFEARISILRHRGKQLRAELQRMAERVADSAVTARIYGNEISEGIVRRYERVRRLERRNGERLQDLRHRSEADADTEQAEEFGRSVAATLGAETSNDEPLRTWDDLPDHTRDALVRELSVCLGRRSPQRIELRSFKIGYNREVKAINDEQDRNRRAGEFAV